MITAIPLFDNHSPNKSIERFKSSTLKLAVPTSLLLGEDGGGGGGKKGEGKGEELSGEEEGV